MNGKGRLFLVETGDGAFHLSLPKNQSRRAFLAPAGGRRCRLNGVQATAADLYQVRDALAKSQYLVAKVLRVYTWGCCSTQKSYSEISADKAEG